MSSKKRTSPTVRYYNGMSLEGISPASPNYRARSVGVLTRIDKTEQPHEGDSSRAGVNEPDARDVEIFEFRAGLPCRVLI